MKKSLITICAVLTLAITACNNSNISSEKTPAADSTIVSIDTTKLSKGAVFYQCPMDLEVISDNPGSCPKCGMDLEKVIKQ